MNSRMMPYRRWSNSAQPSASAFSQKKTEVGRRVIFLGLRGNFPRPENKMTLLIRLHPKKAKTWILRLNRIIGTGSVSHTELESVIGRLSVTRISFFGRIGRAMLAPMYTKRHMDKC